MNSGDQVKENRAHPVPTTIEPWLTVLDCAKAVDFYREAFDAVETYRLDMPEGGLVIRLSVDGAGFWVSNGGIGEPNRENLGGGTIRLILIVSNPYTMFEKAIAAGGSEIFPVAEGFGWLLGRMVDPFGLHWEIGHPLTAS